MVEPAARRPPSHQGKRRPVDLPEARGVEAVADVLREPRTRASPWARKPSISSSRNTGSTGSPDVHMLECVMPALTPCATPVRADDSALLQVLEAYIETLKAENEILKRRLADAEARAEQETAKAEEAIAAMISSASRTRLRPWYRSAPTA